MVRADMELAASGDHAPDFRLPAAGGGYVRLKDLLATGAVVLSFYRGDWSRAGTLRRSFRRDKRWWCVEMPLFGTVSAASPKEGIASPILPDEIGTALHICDSDSINVSRAAGHAVFHPLKIYAVEASWFVVWIPGNARKTGPFVCAFAENTVSAIGRRRPVEQRRIFRDRRGTGAQSVRNFSASVTGGVPALCIESQPAIKHTIAINLIS
jgi:hypothetical protein